MTTKTHNAPQLTAAQAKARPSWVRRHRFGIIGWSLGLVAIIWFFGIQPRTVTTVDEAFPAAAPKAAVTAPATGANAANTALAPAAPITFASGSFAKVAEDGSGTASLVRLADGKEIVRLENFRVDNGPDLRVILRSANGTSLDLGGLKGNAGNQSYDIPAGTDLAQYTAAEVWCRSVNMTFVRAALTR